MLKASFMHKRLTKELQFAFNSYYHRHKHTKARQVTFQLSNEIPLSMKFSYHEE